MIDAKFEKISKYADDAAVIIPVRKTADSAGYDFCAAEDTIIPPMNDLMTGAFGDKLMAANKGDYSTYSEWKNAALTLQQVSTISKLYGAKPTLVPTGIKCKIPKGYYLQLNCRSSLPLKHWLIMANSVGIIDGDYYNNPDNEGHIYFQLINLLPVSVKIQKGECFGQGILIPYETVDGDNTTAARVGGFGSTNV